MRPLAVCAAALALTLAACSPQPSAPPRIAVVHNLVEELPVAELHREAGTIDFGTPEAQAHMREGWYPSEANATTVWSKGRSSALEIWLAAPRPLRAEIVCAPLTPRDGKPQVVTVALNGRRIGEISLRPQLNGYVLDLPREAQVVGRNRLEFRYRRVTRADRRHLAVSWDTLRLTPGPAVTVELPRAEPGSGSQPPTLFLPFGTGVDYHFALEEGGTLSLQGVQGQAHGSLQLVAQEDGGAESILETLQAGAGPRSLELPGRGARLVRLALRAVPNSAATSATATGGLLLLGPAVRATAAGRADQDLAEKAPERPNVIVYLVDTLRADRVGPYHDGPSITPRIDAFAKEATVFENAVAQAPWTTPSVASILTGLGPLFHGVRQLRDKLAPEAVTAAELFHAAGYQTAAFSTNRNVRNTTGLDQGFTFFDFTPDDTASDRLNQRVFRWLDHQAKSPFFLYVHAFDPHAPYTPPEGWRTRFAPDAHPDAGKDFARVYPAKGKERRRLIAAIRALYDAEVAFNDHSFGAFLDDLRKRGLYDNSVIVFVADHGEEFDEHSAFGHGNNLYNETLNVPLIVRWPGQRRGQRVGVIAQHVDILPTLLRAAGLQEPQGLPGLDLALVSRENPEALSGRQAVSHLGNRGVEGISVIHANWKLIHPLSPKLAETSELYHRSADRAERTNRLASLPVRTGWLESLIRREQERSKNGLKAHTYEMDEETRKALKALGYL